ncbi:tetratricopeptide repeat protein [Spirochaeta isovalerica]|uniref:Tetratricopeptide (TPR) repeat protein n=1 Tax=Spirochaeta isovalerica TaxID=150 RepID=A0A841RA86_9SPIO|nr:tetratricopeptide repeat protein [Spirochaeta isovalerica]MBB6480825.1 tetratricopeptide (TPR) repeat protein [Spirochaeta isovalerica]
MDAQINLALDYFGQGDYEKAISLLEAVLIIDPENERAADLLVSVRELYRMERELSKTNNTDDEEFTAQRPDFSVNPTRDEETDPQEDEELNKPDFSINEEDDLVQPEETRSRFELIVSPSLVYTWDVGEEGEVFPSVGTYSASVSSEMNYYFSKWNRIVGISGGYSLLLLDPEWGSFADARLHVVDALITFRTFFQEEVDSKTVLRIGAGYRGYYAGGYNFYTLNKGWLNGFNMGVNLEGPLLYLFRSNEGLKKFIMGIDMNLLFFPEMNTLNLFDFKIEARLQFDHFSAGLHFGAYSVITPDESKYIWMNGINFRFRL